MDSENHGTLVLLNDAEARGLELLEDFRFPAVSLKGLRPSSGAFRHLKKVSKELFCVFFP